MAVLSQVLCPLATGKGRVAAFEFMVVTPAISNLIRENKTYRIDSSIQTGKKLGMQLMDEHIWQLYDEGKITLEEMLEKGRAAWSTTGKSHRKDEKSRQKDIQGNGRYGTCFEHIGFDEVYFRFLQIPAKNAFSLVFFI